MISPHTLTDPLRSQKFEKLPTFVRKKRDTDPVGPRIFIWYHSIPLPELSKIASFKQHYPSLRLRACLLLKIGRKSKGKWGNVPSTNFQGRKCEFLGCLTECSFLFHFQLWNLRLESSLFSSQFCAQESHWWKPTGLMTWQRDQSDEKRNLGLVQRKGFVAQQSDIQNAN